MCFMAAFNASDRCLHVAPVNFASNHLFPEKLVRLSSPEDHFALLFIKQENKLVHIRSSRKNETETEWSITYSYVHLKDSSSDVSKEWKSAVYTEKLDYDVIGAIEHYKRYGLKWDSKHTCYYNFSSKQSGTTW